MLAINMRISYPNEWILQYKRARFLDCYWVDYILFWDWYRIFFLWADSRKKLRSWGDHYITYMNVFSFLIDYLHNLSELAACIAAAYYHKYLNRSFMKWFLPFFIFIFIAELTEKMQINVFSISYVIGVVEAIFYSFVFYNLIEGRKNKNLIISLMSLVVLNYFIAYFFLDTDGYYQTYYVKNLIFFGFLITIIALIYLYQLFKNQDKIIQEPGFWIAFGVVVFFSGISIVFLLYPFIVANNIRLFGEMLYKIIARFLCVVLYGSFIVSMVLYKKKVQQQQTKIM
jgi:hypothetical protein